jgi:hypothetical protein
MGSVYIYVYRFIPDGSNRDKQVVVESAMNKLSDLEGFIREKYPEDPVVHEILEKIEELKEKPEGESCESFAVKLIRFEKDGKKMAVVARYDGKDENCYHRCDHQLRHSYCDEREIIERAFYRSLTAVGREISNAGLER